MTTAPYEFAMNPDKDDDSLVNGLLDSESLTGIGGDGQFMDDFSSMPSMDEMPILPPQALARGGSSDSTTQTSQQPTMADIQFVAQSQARVGASSVTMNVFRRSSSKDGSDLKPEAVLSAADFRPTGVQHHHETTTLPPKPAEFVNLDRPEADMRDVFDMFRDDGFPNTMGSETRFMDMMPIPLGNTGMTTSSMGTDVASTLRAVTFDEEPVSVSSMAGKGTAYDRMRNLHCQANVTPSPQAEMSPWLEKNLLYKAPPLPLSGKIVYKVDHNLASEITKHKHWTDEEDAQLRLAVERETPQGGKQDWKYIARRYFGNTRSATQCKTRWKNHLTPGVIRGKWQPHEDQIIVHMLAQGRKWSEIAYKLPGRIGENIRERYVNNLDPKLIKTPWTEREDKILFQMHGRLANKWSEIRKAIPGRSENNIKNRYHNRKNAHRRKLKREAEERQALAEGRAYWDCPHLPAPSV